MRLSPIDRLTILPDPTWRRSHAGHTDLHFAAEHAELSALILLVDRDADTRAILRAAFEHRGYEVLDASDGAVGLRLASEQRPDVIVGDFPLDVPGHSPFTAAARTLGRPEARILAFTPRALPGELMAARAVCDEVVTKPASPLKVVEVVERLLGGGTSR